MYFWIRELIATQDKSNLRAVSMCDDHIPATCDHIGNVFASLFNGTDLRSHIFMFLVADQRIAAHGDDSGFVLGGHRVFLSRGVGWAYPIVSAITAFCACRRFSASSYTTEFGPSITASVTSILRSAGSGCM